MSQQTKNQNLHVPISFIYVNDPVLQGNFAEAVRPIFWGPNQLVCNYNSYVVPVQSSWRNFEHLNIPQVVRFHYNNSTYNTDDFKDDGDTPTPPVFHCGNFSWIMENTFSVGFTIEPGWTAILSGGYPNPGDYAYVLNVNTLLNVGNLRITMENTNIEVKFGGTTVFTGTVWDWMMSHGPGQQGQSQFRCVYWFAKCGMGELPPAEQKPGSIPSRQVCTGAFDTAEFYDGPPRCWFEFPAGSNLWMNEHPVAEEPFLGNPNLDRIWSAWYGNLPSTVGVNPCGPKPTTPTSPPDPAGQPMVPLPPQRDP